MVNPELPFDAAGRAVQDIQTWEQGLDVQANTLRELFITLKTDLLDSFLQPGKGHFTEEHIRILREQVKHILLLAHDAHYNELESMFTEEARVLDHIESLLREYPSADISNSPDLCGQLENLRLMMHDQQSMIFDRHEILRHEKQELIRILSQVVELKDELAARPIPLHNSEELV